MAANSNSQPVHVAITRRVKPGREQEFQAALKEFFAKSLTQTQSVLSGADLDKTRGKSLGEALKSVNGVTGLQSGASIVKPVINGLHSNRILIMNNGVRQEGQQWGSEHAPEIDPFLATQITVIKGASGVRYGSDAMGGVVLLEPPPLRAKPGMGGEVNLVGYSNSHQGVASGFLEGSPAAVPGLGWRLQGTAKKAGATETPRYFLNNTGFEEFNWSAAGMRTSRCASCAVGSGWWGLRRSCTV